MAVVPGIGEVVSGFRLPEMLRSRARVLPIDPSQLVLLFLGRLLPLDIIRKAVQPGVRVAFSSASPCKALLTYCRLSGGRPGLSAHAGGRFPWLDAYKLALVLSSLAFLGASLITFRKADFSQPKRKSQALIKYAPPSLRSRLALVGGLARPPARAQGGARSRDGRMVGGKAFFSTTRGLYRYDVAGDKVSRLRPAAGSISTPSSSAAARSFTPATRRECGIRAPGHEHGRFGQEAAHRRRDVTKLPSRVGLSTLPFLPTGKRPSSS